MADIFLSYADEDRARAVRVVETLRGLGWTVWWSGDLPTAPFNGFLSPQNQGGPASRWSVFPSAAMV